MSKLLDAGINLRPDTVEALDYFIDHILFLLQRPELQVEVVPKGPDQDAKDLIEYLGEER
jgi:hypothetical protein